MQWEDLILDVAQYFLGEDIKIDYDNHGYLGSDEREEVTIDFVTLSHMLMDMLNGERELSAKYELIRRKSNKEFSQRNKVFSKREEKEYENSIRYQQNILNTYKEERAMQLDDYKIITRKKVNKEITEEDIIKYLENDPANVRCYPKPEGFGLGYISQVELYVNHRGEFEDNGFYNCVAAINDKALNGKMNFWVLPEEEKKKLMSRDNPYFMEIVRDLTAQANEQSEKLAKKCKYGYRPE